MDQVRILLYTSGYLCNLGTIDFNEFLHMMTSKMVKMFELFVKEIILILLFIYFIIFVFIIFCLVVFSLRKIQRKRF